jgi:hypothetical protein
MALPPRCAERCLPRHRRRFARGQHSVVGRHARPAAGFRGVPEGAAQPGERHHARGAVGPMESGGKYLRVRQRYSAGDRRERQRLPRTPWMLRRRRKVSTLNPPMEMLFREDVEFSHKPCAPRPCKNRVVSAPGLSGNQAVLARGLNRSCLLFSWLSTSLSTSVDSRRALVSVKQ